MSLAWAARLLSQRRLELLHAPGQVVASALEVAHLPVELRAVGHELLAPCPQRPVLLRHESVLVLQRRPLLLDLLKALLLGANSARNRGQLFADRMQAPLVVLELPLGALEFRLPLRERGAGFRGGRSRRRRAPSRDPLRAPTVPGAGRRARCGRASRTAWSAAQALVRFAQGLEFPLRLEVGDFRALDLDQRLIDRDQGFVELGADASILRNENSMASRCVRRPSLRRPIESKVRATFSDLARFPVAAMIGRRERARIRDGGAGSAESSRLPAHSEWQGSRVVRGRRAVLKQLFPNQDPWRVP